MRGLGAALVFCITIAIGGRVRAAESEAHTSAREPNKDTPSVFSYAYRGLLAGSLVGLSGGYLAARRDGFDGSDWKPMVYGASFGALGGVALGLTLGFVDMRDRSNDLAAVALKDTLCAGALGTLVGAIIGGLVTINTHDAEHVGFGAAVGTLSGVGVGLVVGVVRGSHHRRKDHAARAAEEGPGKTAEPTKPAAQLAPTWSAVADAQGRRTWLLGASGRF